MNKPEVIKVVHEEAKKIGINPKTVISSQAKEKFKKAQDAEHEVLKREHTQKAKRLMELNKKRVKEYKWTISSRLKPELLLMSRFIQTPSLQYLQPDDIYGKRYERLKKIPEELEIQSALPAPVSQQAPSYSSGRKRKHMELEPKIKIPRLECNRALPKNVPFVNNMVIEEPEYGIFFTDVFGYQAFQRWNDIDKVGIDALVSYMVSASMVQTPENTRFNMKPKKLIVEHPDQEKLPSKKVKLEALG
ncbi:hypothetical protein Tco_0672654 [Tanacetum coccineum]